MFTKIEKIDWFELETHEWFIRAEAPGPDGRNPVVVRKGRNGDVAATGYLKLTARNVVRFEDAEGEFPKGKLEKEITWVLREQQELREKGRASR